MPHDWVPYTRRAVWERVPLRNKKTSQTTYLRGDTRTNGLLSTQVMEHKLKPVERKKYSHQVMRRRTLLYRKRQLKNLRKRRNCVIDPDSEMMRFFKRYGMKPTNKSRRYWMAGQLRWILSKTGPLSKN